MKFHRMGKWGDNSLQSWGTKEYERAKKELAEVELNASPATEAPADWRREMKQRRKEAREKRGLKSSR